MKLTIAHLYPKMMNIYSDMGNIICLQKRCQWRGIKTKVIAVEINNQFEVEKYDLVFAGGGQDIQQVIIASDLQKKKKFIKAGADAGLPMLTTCGSYQLFGHYFKTQEGIKIPGISIFDAYTIASSQRKIGNIVIKINPCLSLNSSHLKINNNLVGFENHSGNTFIKNFKCQMSNVKTAPLGAVIKGFGNNGEDKTEGAIYKNVIGTYLHGPVLPKNPHLADWLIAKALSKKYQKAIYLKPLDDYLEFKTHQSSIKLTYQIKKSWFW
jgi:CobQ-like glutamine amidotransferase family enzyme